MNVHARGDIAAHFLQGRPDSLPGHSPPFASARPLTVGVAACIPSPLNRRKRCLLPGDNSGPRPREEGGWHWRIGGCSCWTRDQAMPRRRRSSGIREKNRPASRDRVEEAASTVVSQRCSRAPRIGFCTGLLDYHIPRLSIALRPCYQFVGQLSDGSLQQGDMCESSRPVLPELDPRWTTANGLVVDRCATRAALPLLLVLVIGDASAMCAGCLGDGTATTARGGRGWNAPGSRV